MNFGFRRRECQRIEHENIALARRLLNMESEFSKKAFEGDFRKHLVYRRQILKVKPAKYARELSRRLTPLTSMRSTYYSNREGALTRGEQTEGSRTARDKKKDSQLKKKEGEEKDDEFLDEMAGVGLGGRDDKAQDKDKNMSNDKSKEKPKETSKPRKNEDSDESDGFLDDMAGMGMMGGGDGGKSRRAEHVRKEDKKQNEPKAETNNIVGTIESRENN